MTAPASANGLKALVDGCARECGFDLVRLTTAEDFEADREAALERIREGRMDGLPWFTEHRVNRGTSPQELLPGARSVICLGLSYLEDGEQATGDDGAMLGRVARYAWVRDYHRVIKRRMRDLVRKLEERLGSEISAKWYVDDGPMLDRAAAARSGLGWFGKSTNILTPSHGSWVFLGQVITDLELEADPPLKKTCGSCVRCIDDCPTGAIVAPYVVDNSRCISYLTIENRGAIPPKLRPLVGDWVFGCDICQDVCPVNRKALPSATPVPDPKGGPLSLLELTGLLAMTDGQFLQRFQGTSIMRAKREGMQRNACVALGNLGDPAAIPALRQTLAEASPLVRRHAAWALGCFQSRETADALRQALASEKEPGVLEEIKMALATVEPGGGAEASGQA